MVVQLVTEIQAAVLLTLGRAQGAAALAVLELAVEAEVRQQAMAVLV
jgi:hypothetical protein